MEFRWIRWSSPGVHLNYVGQCKVYVIFVLSTRLPPPPPPLHPNTSQRWVFFILLMCHPPPPPSSHPNVSQRWFFSFFRHVSHHHHLPLIQTQAEGGYLCSFDMSPITTTSLASKSEVVLFGGFDTTPTTKGHEGGGGGRGDNDLLIIERCNVSLTRETTNTKHTHKRSKAQ
jgi:hypothetical protein